MVIKKSKFTSEKAGVLGIGMALLSLGVATLTTASQHIELTQQFALEVTFGISMLALGYICLKLREYLKFNRWGHIEIECDNTIMQRLITWVEGE